MLGENSEEAITSGDEVADANDRTAFVASFKSKHQLMAEGKDKMILVVGESDWPLPIPQGEIVNILLKIKNSFLPTKQILIGL